MSGMQCRRPPHRGSPANRWVRQPNSSAGRPQPGDLSRLTSAVGQATGMVWNIDGVHLQDLEGNDFEDLLVG